MDLTKYQPQVSNEDLRELTKGSNFIPSIRIASGMSKTQGQVNIPIGSFFLAAQDAEDSIPLGTFGKDTDGETKGIIEVGLGIYRPHAMFLENGKIVKESFNNKDTVWSEIKRAADRKVEGASYGLDFLFWLPPHMMNFDKVENHKSIDKLKEKYGNGTAAVLYYKGTSKQYAPIAKPAGFPLRIKTKKIVAKFTWWVPAEHESFKADWFNPQKLLSEAEKFNNDIPEVLESAPQDNLER